MPDEPMRVERLTLMILAALPCGCRVTDGGDGALHVWPCCDEHAVDLAAAARNMSLPTEGDDE